MMVCAKLLLRWAGPAVVIPTVSLLLLSPVRSREDAPTQTTAQASKGQSTVPGTQGRPQPQGPTGPSTLSHQAAPRLKAHKAKRRPVCSRLRKDLPKRPKSLRNSLSLQNAAAARRDREETGPTTHQCCQGHGSPSISRGQAETPNATSASRSSGCSL